MSILVIELVESRQLPTCPNVRQVRELQTMGWTILADSLRKIPQPKHKEFLLDTFQILMQQEFHNFQKMYNEIDPHMRYAALASLIVAYLETENPEMLIAAMDALMLATQHILGAYES